jgi:hypothetical protein
MFGTTSALPGHAIEQPSPPDHNAVEKGFGTSLQIGDAFFSGVKSRAMLLLLIGGMVMGGSVVVSVVGDGGSHVRKVGKESMLPAEPQSVADMLHEAEKNLGEQNDSPFPNEPTDKDDEKP